MKVLLMSMPDVAPLIIHEAAIHMPNLGVASVAANIDAQHEVHTVDLIRKRRNVKQYVTRTLKKLRPDLVGLSSMTWQYETCVKIIRLAKRVLPEAKIVIGGYHPTLMYEQIAQSPESSLIDFIVRGEGEEACRRLVNALDDGRDSLSDIPSLSYRKNGAFVHNKPAELADLSKIKRPVRDRRRLTWGYHLMTDKIEVMETSRGCTRSCNFCSIRHMYGKNFRTFPIERVIQDLDEIYYRKKTRWVFVSDDNIVLDTKRLMALCEAIIQRNYKGLTMVIQADCVTISRNEALVAKMARAGMNSVFLGIENVSKKNLKAAGKGDIVEASRKAVALCRKYGIMVVGGLVVGFPDDDEQSIVENFQFLNELDVDVPYCQLLNPYPKTAIRKDLLDANLIQNRFDYKWYNGLWANVRTRRLSAEQLQYYYWYHKQNILGWLTPREDLMRGGKIWAALTDYVFQPMSQYFFDRKIRKLGWKGWYREDVAYLKGINRFEGLDDDA